MATTDYGTKYQCFQCGTKFYDLHRPEPICPKCRANQKEAPPPSEPGKTIRETRRPAEEIEEVEAPEPETGIEEEEIGGVEEDEALDEEPSDDEEY